MPSTEETMRLFGTYDQNFRSADQMRWARLDRNKKCSLKSSNRRRRSFEYEFFNYEMLKPTVDSRNRTVYPVALYTNWSEAPRKIAVCKRSYEEYLQLWSFYYDSLELFRPLAKVLSMTLMTTDMVNCLTIGRKQTRARNPVPCVPFPPSDMLMPNIFNTTKRALQISDFFAVNAPFYDFHKCQVVMNFMYTDLPMSLVLGLNARPTSVTKPVDSSYLLSQKYEQPELDKVAGGKKQEEWTSEMLLNLSEIAVLDEGLEVGTEAIPEAFANDPTPRRPGDHKDIKVTVVKESKKAQQISKTKRPCQWQDIEGKKVVRYQYLSNYQTIGGYRVRAIDNHPVTF